MMKPVSINSNISIAALSKINEEEHEQQHHHRSFGKVLPVDFQPSPHTVIIGRGKAPKQNMGNKRLVVLVSSLLKKYHEGDKTCKSNIVSDIIDMIRQACNNNNDDNNSTLGAFVKKGMDGKWYEVETSLAREKIGYVFRDLLADDYKSSSKSKVARRQYKLYIRPREQLQQQAKEENQIQQEKSSYVQHDANYWSISMTGQQESQRQYYDCPSKQQQQLDDTFSESTTTIKRAPRRCYSSAPSSSSRNTTMSYFNCSNNNPTPIPFSMVQDFPTTTYYPHKYQQQQQQNQYEDIFSRRRLVVGSSFWLDNYNAGEELLSCSTAAEPLPLDCCSCSTFGSVPSTTDESFAFDHIVAGNNNMLDSDDDDDDDDEYDGESFLDFEYCDSLLKLPTILSE